MFLSWTISSQSFNQKQFLSSRQVFSFFKGRRRKEEEEEEAEK